MKRNKDEYDTLCMYTYVLISKKTACKDYEAPQP